MWPDYDSFYCIWDSYRSIHPLITLVDPYSQTLMVRALIDIYRFEGWLPDCRMDLCKGYTQGGSNADVVLADTFVKGFTDGIDWETGYEAVVKDAEGMLQMLVRVSRVSVLIDSSQSSPLSGRSRAVEDLRAGRVSTTFPPTTLIRMAWDLSHGPSPERWNMHTMTLTSR